MPKSNSSVAILLMAILSLIWGTSFILMKRGLDVYTPYQVGALRMVISFISLFPFVLNGFSKIPRNKWKYIVAAGFLGNGIPAILFPLAETGISSSMAGMLNSLTPVFTLILGITFFSMQLTRNRMLGVLLGLAGAFLLVTTRSNDGMQNNYLFSLAVIIATICYAFTVNILRNQLADVDSLLNTGFALMFVGPPAAAFLFSTDFIDRTATSPNAFESLGCIAILAVFGTAISTFLFNDLIKKSGALFASSVTYLIPVVAVIWGLFDGESFHLYYLAGMCAVLGGVYLINRR